ncbi:class I SAM-dependent methyltransferase [Streptacidiphilus neutrinimicus]|uniref:class I SAM-dependent methyltransferase n=1 Tax=Streptacidiphilus neutrinimicus TaxID=105420 RepID=UPI0005AA6428|nr:class I SAM-dependent methyltransferase [Streptacidiphilus neutrinimicus]
MAKNHPTTVSAQPHDYLPAAGRDALLPFYDRLTALLGAGELHRTLLAQVGLADGLRVLEIGCGTGNLSVRAKRAHPGVELTGSDPDPLALAVAERKAAGLDGIRFERGYAQRLPYSDAGFDRVLSALMLHHLDDEAKAATAAEVRRVLRPGGSLHLVDFTGTKHGPHGYLASRLMKSGHFSAESAEPGDDILRLLATAGLDATLVATRRHRFLGRVGYYRAGRPA